MNVNKATFAMAIAALGLASCGEVGEILGDLNTINTITENADRIGNMAETAASALPTGTADYSGHVLGVMTPRSSGTEAFYWGDVALTANFGTASNPVNTLEGSVSNVRGLDREENIGNALGSIVLSNGTISGGEAAIDYDGDIIVGRDSLSFSGTANGEFHGSSGEGILLGDGSSGTINGVPYLSEFYIIAEQ